MKILVNVVLVPLCIILLCAFLYAGMKALFRNMGEKIKGMFFKKNKREEDVQAQKPEAMMDIVTITAGTCQSCGRTFIGTTADKDCPLKVVKFMGETKVICDDCLKKLLAEFNKTHVSSEKHYSKSANDLKNMLAKVDCQACDKDK